MQAAAGRLAQRQQQHRRQRKAGRHLQQLESVDDVFEDLVQGMANVQVSVGVGRAVVQREGGLQEKVEGRSGPELRRQGRQPLGAAVAKGGGSAGVSQACCWWGRQDGARMGWSANSSQARLRWTACTRCRTASPLGSPCSAARRSCCLARTAAAAARAPPSWRACQTWCAAG